MATSNAPRWSADQAQRIVEHYRASGQRVRDYAGRHRVSAKRLYRWRQRFPDPTPSQGAFVEVVAAPTMAMSTLTATPASASLASSAPAAATAVVRWPQGPTLEVPVASLDALVGALVGRLSC